MPVVIDGSFFNKGATVTITNGTTTKTVPATIVSQNQIKCTLPLTSLPYGLYDVTVKNTDGSSATSPGAFRVSYQVPTVTTINPLYGYSTGPISITLSGMNFVDGIEVSLVNNGTIIPGVVSSFTPTKYIGTFNLTNATSGLYSLSLKNPDGTNGTKPSCFTVREPNLNPSITNFNPITGLNTGSLPIVINGSNFRTGILVTIINGSVGKTVTGTVTGNSSIKCTLPLNGLPFGNYTLTVKNVDGTTALASDELQVKNPTPVVNSLTLTYGYNTSPIQIGIIGSKFISGVQASLVNGSTTLNGSISSVTSGKIIGTFDLTDAPTVLYSLHVVNPGGPDTTKPNCFTVKPADLKPSVSTVSPSSGLNTGTVSVIITGDNFRNSPKVTITNGSSTKTVSGTIINKTQIKCSLPLTNLPYGLYNLTVLNADGTSGMMENAFFVTNPPPTITAITPATGYMTGIVPVTITGTKFAAGAEISLVNGSFKSLGTVTSVSATKITGSFLLPCIPPGLYNLTVTNPGNASTTKLRAFTVQSPGTAAVISKINPSSGFNNAKLPVTITGSNFNKPTVYISQGSVLRMATATAGKASTLTTLYVTLPLTSLPGGLYTVTVRNSDGVNTTAADIFYVTDQAWVSKGPKTVSKSAVVQGSAMAPIVVVPSGSPGFQGRPVV